MQNKTGQQGNEHCSEEIGILSFSALLLSVEQHLLHGSVPFEKEAAATDNKGEESVKINTNKTVVATVLRTFIINIFFAPLS
ncbi:hypothetical protein [Sinanaerobacter chloroacetimidivorans]|uniref:hypothetical protein n=1 Tax=Sinanaerobacter chloroacetimidivorans TaxID=2818044 RepID=UPI001D03E680|nr:hypothetical protein [Sinanaerobacter chloroacetimidivorans]